MNRIQRYLPKNYEPIQMEDSSIIACYVYEDELDFDEYKEFTNISDVENFSNKKIKWNFGDLVSFREYRDTGTYIIGKEGKLVDNPDYTDSGYLTIPYEITQYLDDATIKYKSIEPSYIDIRHDDNYIKNNIGIVDKKWNFKYVYSEYEGLSVEFPNKKNHEFNNCTPEDIYNYYLGTLEEQDKIKVSYSFKNEKYDEFKKNHNGVYDLKINKLWNMKSGSGGGGYKSSHGNLNFYGPKRCKNEVLNSINTFFKGYDYTINES